MRPTLIAGAGGMLAQALARALQSRGQRPILLDRAACDITDESSVQRLFDTYNPAIVFNAAAYTKVDAAEREPEVADAVNGLAVGRLARFAKEHDTTLVHFSTDFVFDGHTDQPYRPGDPTGPLSVYGTSKLLGETQLLAHAPPRWLILRTAWLFGHPGVCFPATILRLARQGQPLRVVNDQFGSPTHADDLASAAIGLVEKDAIGLFHIANAGVINWFDFAVAILRQFDVTADLTPITAAQRQLDRPHMALRPAYSALDSSAAEAALGEPMRPWREALVDFHRATRESSVS